MRLYVAASPLRRALLLSTLAAPLLAAAALPARAGVITAEQILEQFNGVISGTMSSPTDVEGRLVAGTIDSTTSTPFYSNPNPLSSPSSFQAVNALTIESCPSCDVDNGGSVNYVDSNAGSFSFNAGGGNPKGSLVQNMPAFSMSDFTTPLNALQTQLGALTANSNVKTSPNSLDFDVTPVDGLAVFDISTTDLEAANDSITFTDATSATTIIINVTGGSFAEAGGENFNGDAYLAEHVIWNFEGATTLSMGQWYGAVLAGDATVTNSSPLNGFLYAENLAAGGELHDYPFEGTISSPVPEPSTWAMMALGFAGLGFAGFRRRKAPRLDL
jgi:choice-of-anchor A domain-containing protein